jgi:hypothetical protein
MKMTILKADNAVYKDFVAYLDLNLPTIPSNVRALQFDSETALGHIEFEYLPNTAPPPNEIITELPEWANACFAVWDDADYLEKNPPAPTPEQLLQICKNLAKKYLEDTDWSEVPSVSDSANTPHLLNLAEYVAYRNAIRNLAVNPVTNPTWPAKPVAKWSS